MTKTVFFDIDTQFDFLLPAGALYVAGAESILPAVSRLNRFAQASGITVVSTADAHLENDPEFRHWPAHCVRGAIGQQKAPGTLLDRRTVLPNAPARIELAPQVIVEKQALDCFTNQNLPALLEALGADRYVVYGVVTEYCVRCAALGLAKTGKQVEVVADAVQSLSGEAGRAAFDELAAAGVSLTTVSACSGET